MTEALPEITDDYMRQRLTLAKPYTVVLLRKGPNPSPEGRDAIIWEHGRRNMALGAAGLMPLVFPVGNENLAGLGVFTGSEQEVRDIMDGDPAVRAGIFVYDAYPCRGFPGAALP